MNANCGSRLVSANKRPRSVSARLWHENNGRAPRSLVSAHSVPRAEVSDHSLRPPSFAVSPHFAAGQSALANPGPPAEVPSQRSLILRRTIPSQRSLTPGRSPQLALTNRGTKLALTPAGSLGPGMGDGGSRQGASEAEFLTVSGGLTVTCLDSTNGSFLQ